MTKMLDCYNSVSMGQGFVCHMHASFSASLDDDGRLSLFFLLSSNTVLLNISRVISNDRISPCTLLLIFIQF